jgi:hypothetical protein
VKRLEVAGLFNQYSLSLLCSAFVTVSLFGDLLCLYMALWSSSHYILVGMGMHWLECVIAIVEKVEWNTFVFG